ncbi:uncharacterized protein [Arachis hypogaea]|uniref:uncharacterized protein n=1 Tax=Arachis hypogaea TaxID=3818 RepID=UPI000DEC152C|nr:uncharacterized protein LOC112749010 [Arachis hypogaea]
MREMPSGKVLVVDLARRVCDCGHFQVKRLPCCHVIACYVNQRLDWQVYVNDVYKMSEIRKVYRVEFVPVGDPETWPGYSEPTLVANPTLRRTSKGQPKGPRICHLCGKQGHCRSRCLQYVGPSGVGSSGGS